MRVFGKSGRLGLLRSEEALLLLGEIEEPPRRLSVRLGHCTILQLSWCFVSHENWRHSHPRKLRSRQGYAFSALFPDIRELPKMTGLLDLERQGYGFRAARLCFKAHGALRRVGSPRSTASANEMRRNQANKFTWRDDLRILPERRKVFTIAGDQKVGTSRIGALDEDVVVWIARHFDPARGAKQMTVVLDELKQLQPQPFPNG
jgi:hypothetical protein